MRAGEPAHGQARRRHMSERPSMAELLVGLPSMIELSSSSSESPLLPLAKMRSAAVASASSTAFVPCATLALPEVLPPDLDALRAFHASRFALDLAMRSFRSASFSSLVALGHSRSTCCRLFLGVLVYFVSQNMQSRMSAVCTVGPAPSDDHVWPPGV